ncbi:ubiquitin fusion degradation protein UFD1 [Nitzschia inconspicua]|uniref:Ubiquitin fusion degradation protein UFD1 n=1 Tax=Nitzschia inconspicua TaxID=303405 RepID=A0A9K3LFU8_9STRA|nr:ubiquitin fusion degradation protein UFD1 [Nitzschia inconspicua]
MMHGGGFFGGGGFGGGFGAARRFEEQYHCYSVAYADKSHLEKGDKILLPPSAFDTLARLQVDYPMLFRLSSMVDNRMTHCGVLEFTADEGTCYIPFWMMQNLLIEEGSVITVTNVSLPKATFVKLQPQSVDFLEISNPRAVLEHALRNFSCVTKGDIIQVPYNNRNYHLALKDVQPQDAACIIETDCNVDFDAPVGYKEPDYKANSAAASLASSKDNEMRSSACPSPATLSAASSATNLEAAAAAAAEDTKPAGIRIVNGKIVRPDDNGQQAIPKTSMLAERAGTTGVQMNAAIPQAAPKVDYWAVNAGDGARLDGKTPSVLKDKDGNEVDIRKLRAEAAARRAEAAAAASSKLLTSTGKNLQGEVVPPDEAAAQRAAASGAPVSKRKTKVGSKYSRIKQSGAAFQGSANNLK